MTPDQETSTGHEGPLAEFVALRQEIDRKMASQHQLLTIQITMSGAIFAFAVADRSRTGLLLALPITTYMLFGRYAAQHATILNIATYIRDVLDSKVPGGLGWERWIQNFQHPHVPAISWVDPLLVNFPGVGLLSLTWLAPSLFFGAWQITVAQRIGLICIWILGLLVTMTTIRLVFLVRRRWWLSAWKRRSRRKLETDNHGQP